MGYFQADAGTFSTVLNVLRHQSRMAARFAQSSVNYTNITGKVGIQRQLTQFLNKLENELRQSEERLLNQLGLDNFQQVQERIDNFLNAHKGLVHSDIGGAEDKLNTNVQQIQDQIFAVQKARQFESLIRNNKDVQEKLLSITLDDAQEQGDMASIAVNLLQNFTKQLQKDDKDNRHFVLTKEAKANLGKNVKELPNGRYGIFRFFDFNLEVKDGLIDFQVRDSDLNLYTTKRIGEVLKAAAGEKVYDSYVSDAGLDEESIDKIAKILEANSKVDLTLTKDILRSNSIDINSSSSSIIGFLGELFWTLLFQEEFNQSPRAIGGLRDTGKKVGKELAIDIVLGSIGCQVKNYSFAKKELEDRFITFHNSDKGQKLNTLMRFRDINFGTATAAIEDFYTSWAYNKVITQPVSTTYINDDGSSEEREVDPNSENTKSYAKEVFVKFSELAAAFEKYLDELIGMQIDKLIGIDRTSGSEAIQDVDSIGQLIYTGAGSRLTQQRLNTVYLLRDKIIPSSQLIREIKLMLERNEDSAIQATVTHSSQEPVMSTKWPAQANPTFENIQKMTMINWEVKIDFNKLIQHLTVE